MSNSNISIESIDLNTHGHISEIIISRNSTSKGLEKIERQVDLKNISSEHIEMNGYDKILLNNYLFRKIRGGYKWMQLYQHFRIKLFKTNYYDTTFENKKNSSFHLTSTTLDKAPRIKFDNFPEDTLIIRNSINEKSAESIPIYRDFKNNYWL